MAEIVGTGRGDTLRGTDRADTILGLGGDDRITARLGADAVDAGPGDDTISWGMGRGAASIDGGAGSDAVTVDAGDAAPGAALGIRDDGHGDPVMTLGGKAAALTLAGVERLLVDGGGTFVVGDLLGTGLERLSLDVHADHVRVDARDAGVGLFVDAGGSGSADFLGGAGDDVYLDAPGRDVVRGGAGDDNLTASSGRDLLDGGIGADQFQLDGSADTVITTGPGADRVNVFDYLVDRGEARITDFDARVDRVDIVGGGRDAAAALDTDHDGRLGAGDRSVHVDARGLHVDLSPVLHGGSAETLTFDHLTSLPLDAFA